MPGIFISHTHNDKALADALSDLVNELFGRGKVEVNYSSRKELDGGIGPGQDWFKWIVNQVRGTDVALILLTPGSIQKPWLLWEAGAVAGTAFGKATEEDNKENVFPMTFGIRSADVPTPFGRTQVLNGTDQADIVKLLDELLERFGDVLQLRTRDLARFGAERDPRVKAYLATINPILLKLPLAITEAAVQEWLGRLDELERENRFSEASVMEDWLNVAFGRDGDDDKARPFDVRIHRKLGELYSRSKRPADAARQFQLACKLAPRDIFLLRRLGKAYLDQGDMRQAKEVLDEILLLDKNAFENNSENAALKARYFEENNDPLGARDVLKAAFASMPSSYYLGDKLGQVLIKLKQTDQAKEVYEQVGRVLDELPEQNVWTHATRLSAAIVCGDGVAAAGALTRLRAERPSRGQLDSIERGIKNLAPSPERDKAIGELSAIESGQ